MTMSCMLSFSRLKPESVQEYVRLHQKVWPELLHAYQDAGITRIDCFLCDCDLVVFSEFKREVYEREKETLNHKPVEVRWQTLMKSLRDPDFESKNFREVFHWEAEDTKHTS